MEASADMLIVGEGYSLIYMTGNGIISQRKKEKNQNIRMRIQK